MIRQDYISRMIEQAAQMLARLMRMNIGGTEAAVAAASDEAAREFLQLPPDRLLGMGDAYLFSHLSSIGSPLELPVRLGVAVQLLQVRADVAARAGQTELERVLRLRAIGLVLRGKIVAHVDELPEFAPSLEGLLSNIESDGLPPETTALLICHLEQQGRFADAENRLFHLYERVGNADAAFRELGDSFYARLASESDERLAAGGLPRNEVEEGRLQWVSLFERT